MKILILHSGVELYGSDRSLIQNIETIKKNTNAHITVILHKPGPLADALLGVVDHIEFKNYGVLSRTDVSKRPIRSLWEVIKGAYYLSGRVKAVDVVYVNTLTVFSAYILFPLLFRQKKIINVREIARGTQRFVFSILLKFSRAKIVFNSFITRDSYLFLPKERIEVLYNFVTPPEGKTVVSKKTVSEQYENILILGRIYPLKGQDFALKAIKELKEQGVEFKLRIVGGMAPGREDYLALIEKYIRDNSLSSLVTLNEFQDDVSKLYEWADIILVPSVYPESFGRTVIEGMALGKIVVASDHGGPSELINHGENGLLFEPNSISALMDCLKTVESDPKKASVISKGARLHYRKNFTEDKFQSKLINILDLGTKIKNER